MKIRHLAALAALATGSAPHAETAPAPLSARAAAEAFGAREQIQQISLSPDGKLVAIVMPYGARGTRVAVADPVAGGAPKVIVNADGTPETIRSCTWTTATRIVCQVSFITDATGMRLGFTRMIAINSDGSKLTVLSARPSSQALGFTQSGGSVIDYSGGGEGSVLMTRTFVPENTTGSHLGSNATGLGIERVDTVTLRRATVEPARASAAEYLTDGQGAVRIMGVRGQNSDGQVSDRISYSYRKAGERAWQPLGALTGVGSGLSQGFDPYAVDPKLDAVYGFERIDGRRALVRISLDGSLKREVVLTNAQVDIDDIVRVGRQQRVVGASFAAEQREMTYFDPEFERLRVSLARALPAHPAVDITDASADEKTLLIHAGSDVDPGRYYVFAKATRAMIEVLPSRPALAGVKLGQMKPVSYRAADGTAIPGYLTLPAGSSGKGLPAIVMPHGGPGSRDEWGFDWWAQFFAARGFAVIQPNFRGSAGYGSEWYQKNGFQSWRTAIGDVNAAGRWLVDQGIADPKKLAIVGWSYGGYAALQSSVLDPGLFKAVIAVAPVTDLEMLRGESQGYTDHSLSVRFIGSGPHIREGSPARNAAAIKAPVLLFHGDLDQNVGVAESRLMEDRLRAAGGKVDYVEFKGLDHQLDDSTARAQMLEKSDAFLRTALGM